MKTPLLAIVAVVPAMAVAAVWWAMGPADESLRTELDELRLRVAQLEQQDELRATALRRTESDVAQLEERVVEAELRAAQDELATPDSPTPDWPTAAAPDTDPDGGLPLRPEDVPRRKAIEKERLEAETAKLLGGMERMKQSISATVGGLKTQLASMELRRLPLAERWERAMADVGLNENQVAVLRQAIAERDAAYAAGSEQEKRQEDDGSWVVETRVDAALLDEGDNRYVGAVNGVMTAEQERRWSELGFAGAFGRRRPEPATQRYPAKR